MESILHHSLGFCNKVCIHLLRCIAHLIEMIVVVDKFVSKNYNSPLCIFIYCNVLFCSSCTRALSLCQVDGSFFRWNLHTHCNVRYHTVSHPFSWLLFFVNSIRSRANSCCGLFSVVFYSFCLPVGRRKKWKHKEKKPSERNNEHKIWAMMHFVRAKERRKKKQKFICKLWKILARALLLNGKQMKWHAKEVSPNHARVQHGVGEWNVISRKEDSWIIKYKNWTLHLVRDVMRCNPSHRGITTIIFEHLNCLSQVYIILSCDAQN